MATKKIVSAPKKKQRSTIDSAKILAGTEVKFMKPVIEVDGKKSVQQIKISHDVSKNTFRIEPKITTDHCSMNNPAANEAMLAGLVLQLKKALEYSLDRRQEIYDATGANPPDSIDFPEDNDQKIGISLGN